MAIKSFLQTLDTLCYNGFSKFLYKAFEENIQNIDCYYVILNSCCLSETHSFKAK